MRAILVCVDYSDLLAITLPYNRHHFSDVMVVTTPCDVETRSIAEQNNCGVFPTTAFYDDGAAFNKWKALEEGLDFFGRVGWLCIMDADILWPKQLPVMSLIKGCLYTPRRRMFEDVTKPPPIEALWDAIPLHPQQREFAGYTQIFHADDAALGQAPWHEVNWIHAGGADSFFQAKWSNSNKIRPPFDVLHLGESGKNWCGRATPYTDGSKHQAGDERYQQLRRLIAGRRQNRNTPYEGEKIKGGST